MSDSVRPHRWQPTRLCCPWDSPGKNTGVGCHFLLQCMKVKSEVKSLSHVWLCSPMDYSLPGSSIHGIFPDKSTGVGCHCLLWLKWLSSTKYKEICFQFIKTWLLTLAYKDLGSCHSHFHNKKKGEQTENQQFFLDPSEDWAHRANPLKLERQTGPFRKPSVSKQKEAQEKKTPEPESEWMWKWNSLSHVWLFETPWTIQSMESSRPESWSG